MTDAEGKSLLQLRREKGEYFFIFFGGRVEEGESPEIAAAREIQEELNLAVDLSELAYLDTWLNPEGVQVIHYKLPRHITWADVSTGEDFGMAMVPYAELPKIPLSLSMKWFYQQYPQLP